MRNKISRFDQLRETVLGLHDDPGKHWSSYPCLIWPRGNKKGFASIPFEGKRGKCCDVVRLAYETAYGPFKGNLFHLCSQKLCYRPSHLYAPGMRALRDLLLTISGDDLTKPWSSYPCLEWPYGRAGKGYGVVYVGVRTQEYVHRAAYRTIHGEIPDGLFVLHHCDNPPCFRPCHLFVGTNSDNVQDAIGKGRFDPHRPQPKLRGSSHVFAKLTDADVVKIRDLALQGADRLAMMRTFGVSRSALFSVIHGLTWKNVERAEGPLPRYPGSNARLTWETVDRIYTLAATGMSQYKIAEITGCKQPHVSDILRGKHWKRVRAC